MNKNNLSQSSIWLNTVKFFKKGLKIIQQSLSYFGTKYPNITQIIQLSFLYFFAIIDLVYSILSTVYSLGYYPEILDSVYPLIQSILTSPFFQIWASPEKVFFLSYLAIELMIVRSVFNFSKLVRYNILLLFSILMIQGLVITYWDFLFQREVTADAVKWTFDQGMLVASDKTLAIFFFLSTFIIFFTFYVILYLIAVQGKFFTSPKLEWLTDSVAFWLKMKTPTMRFGKKK
jgi:hypothetical protein